MNKSRINKILIVALTLIWSFVGYSFFWPKKAADQSLAILENSPLIRDLATKKDEFILKPIARDPFLNSRIAPVKKTKVIPKDRPKSSSKNTKTVWPNIEYFGFVKSNDQSAPLVLLKINNQIKRLRQGEKFEEITVQKVFRDSIIVKMGKEKKSFKKL